MVTLAVLTFASEKLQARKADHQVDRWVFADGSAVG